MRFAPALLALLVSHVVAVEDICPKDLSIIETPGDAVLSVFVDTNHGSECNISSAKSIQEVATALFVVQTLNKLEYVPDTTIGLRLYEACNDQATVYKQALVSAVDFDCSAHHDLGLLVPEHYSEVLQPFNKLDVLPINSYSEPNLTLPLIEALVDFVGTKYASVGQLLTSSPVVLDQFLATSRQAGICLRRSGEAEANVVAAGANETDRVVVAIGDYDELAAWLGDYEAVSEIEEDLVWVVLPLDASLVDDQFHVYGEPILDASLIIKDEYSYIAGIAIKSSNDHTVDRHLCTGVLITKDHVLTTASCTQTTGNEALTAYFRKISVPSPLHVIAILIARKKTYKDWCRDEHSEIRVQKDSDDIAILTLSDSLTTVWPVGISYSGHKKKIDRRYKFIGWGSVGDSSPPENPRGTYLTLLSYENCKEQTKKILPKSVKFTWSDRLVCAAADSNAVLMNGDFGGPVLDKQGDVFGIVIRRAAVKHKTHFGAGQPNLVLLLSDFQDFIRAVTSKPDSTKLATKLLDNVPKYKKTPRIDKI